MDKVPLQPWYRRWLPALVTGLIIGFAIAIFRAVDHWRISQGEFWPY